MRTEELFEDRDQGILIVDKALPELEALACESLRWLQGHRIPQRPTDHILLQLGPLAVLDTVKEHVFDVGFLGCVEGVSSPHLLVILLELFQLFLQNDYIQVT